MIPKLIHQTAKTAEIPKKWQGYQRIVRELHPDWEYKLWTDEDNLAFVRDQMPEFLETFTRLPKNIMRADAIRYVLLYKVGGMYLDLDFEMLKPFDLTQYDCVLPQETPGPFGPDSRIGNSFMAAAPGHPFFKAVLDELRTNPPLEGGDNITVLHSTGPAFITTVLQRLPEKDRINLITPDCELFSPGKPTNPRERRAILNKGLAYGIHHCHASWREYTLMQALRERAILVIRRFT